VLREDHPLFRSPEPLDFSETVEIETPDAWKHGISASTVRVLPLVKDVDAPLRDGWCTYTYEHLQAPELEIVCGGVNAKTHRASAIWRQGNLLHFGFEPSPADFNANGTSLLINAICYIARFTDDRPIIRRSSEGRVLDRDAIRRLIDNEQRDLTPYLSWFFPNGTLLTRLNGMTRDELGRWFESNRHYLSADRRGKFFLDQEAMDFGVPPDSIEFIPSAIEALQRQDDRQRLAVTLLGRYAPGGPNEFTADAWQRWWESNRRYLFFSDSGGFRWYVDPLAKKRGEPSQSLRGVKRATLPTIVPR
jgi:hypothetical protein